MGGQHGHGASSHASQRTAGAERLRIDAGADREPNRTANRQSQILAQNVPVELAERSTDVQYPVVNVYCEKIVNQLKEKFRNFSGKAIMTIEVRVSQDRLDGVQEQLQLYVDAATQVLDQNRGDWGEGMYYAGCYEATLGPVKHGGQNFLQTGKVIFEVGVSD